MLSARRHARRPEGLDPAGTGRWLGNSAPRGIQESFGIMVNYLYDHDSIEDNHEAFVHDRTIVRSPDVDALLEA
jgi:malonyl-CoA decarboxylase